MNKLNDDNQNESTVASRPRRERLERIANAERDRRAGRVGMAIAAIGDPVEWPARVVMALGHWPDAEGQAAREILEEGLDLWARDLNLGSLSEEFSEPVMNSGSPDALSRPIEAAELDLAFESAEAEVESMNDVNSVAERVLAEEPTGLAELAGDVLAVPAGISSEGLDGLAEETSGFSEFPDADVVVDAALVEAAEEPMDSASNARQMSTLKGWLANIERRIEHGQTRRTA